MCSHHLCDTSVSGPEIQEPLSSPARADAEQLLELLSGKHKHRSTAQKPETENTRYEDTLHYIHTTGNRFCLYCSPVDGSA